MTSTITAFALGNATTVSATATYSVYAPNEGQQMEPLPTKTDLEMRRYALEDRPPVGLLYDTLGEDEALAWTTWRRRASARPKFPIADLPTTDRTVQEGPAR